MAGLQVATQPAPCWTNGNVFVHCAAAGSFCNAVPVHPEPINVHLLTGSVGILQSALQSGKATSHAPSEQVRVTLGAEKPTFVAVDGLQLTVQLAPCGTNGSGVPVHPAPAYVHS